MGWDMSCRVGWGGVGHVGGGVCHVGGGVCHVQGWGVSCRGGVVWVM